jgi:hypothetical protein
MVLDVDGASPSIPRVARVAREPTTTVLGAHIRPFQRVTRRATRGRGGRCGGPMVAVGESRPAIRPGITCPAS